ncbi:MAG: hypothetical protein J1F11_12575 [Oscillospiraceae bacterium]|nr:hypothetical protein [Oscillospiraceae bacterium]
MKKLWVIIAACVLCLAASGCRADIINNNAGETSAVQYVPEKPENLVRSNPAAIGYSLEDAVEVPFESYTYDFTAYDNNYMITVAADEKKTGLILTVEDNNFGYTNINVTPPGGYVVYLPYSQQYASSVCTIIRSTEDDCPDLMKIDFYLADFTDERLPYVVSKIYSILGNRLVEVEVYDTYVEDELEKLDYIPESYLYQTEPLKFMPEPVVTQNEDGSFTAHIVTYTLNPHDMTMRRAYEDCTPDSPLYYGYAAHAIAGNIYQYFAVTSLNVADYTEYVEVEVSGEEQNQYFFKVDDPRFSTVQELKDYVGRYFSDDMVSEMFRSAPQKYRDIDGELYTILGDGGVNDTLGKLTITGWETDGERITYYTKQEKLNDNHEVTEYIDGGNFVILTKPDGSFIVEEYRYPTL